MIRKNPNGDYPEIDNTAYIDPSATIIGNTKIGKNVFVGPQAVIRADEPDSSILIEDNCNIQDRVVIHALRDTSVLIENNTSLAHSCMIHGPCKIGKNCFIGFGSVVFNAVVGNGAVIMHLVVVEGANILSGTMVSSSRSISSADDTKELEHVDKKLKEFAKKVIKANLDLVRGYKNE